METITIKIKGKENLPFFLDLMRNLHFVSEVELEDKKSADPLTVNDAPIKWAQQTPDIHDFFGIWKGRDISLSDLRRKAWKRN